MGWTTDTRRCNVNRSIRLERLWHTNDVDEEEYGCRNKCNEPIDDALQKMTVFTITRCSGPCLCPTWRPSVRTWPRVLECSAMCGPMSTTTYMCDVPNLAIFHIKHSSKLLANVDLRNDFHKSNRALSIVVTPARPRWKRCVSTSKCGHHVRARSPRRRRSHRHHQTVPQCSPTAAQQIGKRTKRQCKQTNKHCC